MSRKDPTMPPPEVKQREDPNTITQIRQYKVITPLFGGGVTPAEADPVTIVRGTEVRGHLRFWWRATRGGAFSGDLQKMKEAEDKLWGSTTSPSQISILIETKSDYQEETVFNIVSVMKKDKNGNLKPKLETQTSSQVAAYAAFPLLPDKDEQKKVGWQSEVVLLNVEFQVTLVFPKVCKNDVEAALWAWEIFGGIGARTRRGFGSLERIDKNASPAPTPIAVKKWLEDGLAKHIVKNGQWPLGVPHLSLRSSLYKITARKNDGIGAWKQIISALYLFRQADARYNKETGKKDKYGMSRWPEANEIRRFFGRNPALPEGISPDDLVEKFPRAQFGLPIIFHMAHDDGLKDKTITLQGTENYDRLASPLILRPIACSDGAVGLAAILEWAPLRQEDEPYTPPGGLTLNGVSDDPKVYGELDKTEAKNIPPLKGEPDVLQAFLNFLDS